MNLLGDKNEKSDNRVNQTTLHMDWYRVDPWCVGN